MSQQIMSNYQAILGTVNISPDFGKVTANYTAKLVDNTPMSGTSREYVGGLPEADFDFEGYWQEGTGLISDVLNTYHTGSNTQLICYTIGSPQAGSGAGGFATQVSNLSIIRSEDIGDIGRIRFTAKNNYPVVQVVPLYGLTTRTATNNGNTYVLPAVTAGQTLYGFLAVTAVSGTGPPTLVVKLQSSATGLGGWSDRITFTSTSTVTTEVKTASGPITDTYWQQYWTITGSNPSFTFTSAWGVK